MSFIPLSSATILAILIALSASVFSLLAIFAALGRWHWFLRAALLLAAFGLLIPIGAYELIAFFGLQTAFVFVPLWIARVIKARRVESLRPAAPGILKSILRVRFSMKDMLLLTTVVAVVAAIGAQMWHAEVFYEWKWSVYSTLGFAVPAAIIAIASLRRAPADHAKAVVLISGVVLSALALGRFSPLFDEFSFISAMPKVPMEERRDLTSWTYFLQVVVVALWVALHVFSTRRRSRGGPRHLLAALTGLMVLPLLVIYLRMVFPPPYPQRLIAKPEQILALGAIGEVFTQYYDQGTSFPVFRREFTDHDDIDPHRAQLDDARRLIENLEYEPSDQVLSGQIDFFALARALATAGNEESNLDEKAKWYMCVLRLADALRRTGTIEHVDLAGELESWVLPVLANIAKKLPPANALRLRAELQEMWRQRESFETLFERQRLLWAGTQHWSTRLEVLLEGHINFHSREIRSIRDRVQAVDELFREAVHE